MTANSEGWNNQISQQNGHIIFKMPTFKTCDSSPNVVLKNVSCASEECVLCFCWVRCSKMPIWSGWFIVLPKLKKIIKGTSTETVPKEFQMLDLLDEDFKSVF